MAEVNFTQFIEKHEYKVEVLVIPNTVRGGEREAYFELNYNQKMKKVSESMLKRVLHNPDGEDITLTNGSIQRLLRVYV